MNEVVPEGFRYVWVPDEGWRVNPSREEGLLHRCRWGAGYRSKACGRPSVAALNRRRHVGRGRVDSWWHYCEQHLYGRRLDRVNELVLVRLRDE
jgi:hypothetical protein